MGKPASISQPIIEALYCEALVLADDVRAAFDLTPVRESGGEADMMRLALSCEGLRTTTRIMHILAWLLNHRAYFAGDLTEFQLRRHGKLPADRPSEYENLIALEAPTCELIIETEQLHRRVARLDAAWRDKFAMEPGAVLRLRERLDRAVGSI